MGVRGGGERDGHAWRRGARQRGEAGRACRLEKTKPFVDERWSRRRPGVATRWHTPFASLSASARRLAPPMTKPYVCLCLAHSSVSTPKIWSDTATREGRMDGAWAGGWAGAPLSDGRASGATGRVRERGSVQARGIGARGWREGGRACGGGARPTARVSKGGWAAWASPAGGGVGCLDYTPQHGGDGGECRRTAESVAPRKQGTRGGGDAAPECRDTARGGHCHWPRCRRCLWPGRPPGSVGSVRDGRAARRARPAARGAWAARHQGVGSGCAGTRKRRRRFSGARTFTRR